MNELKPCPFCGGEASIERMGTNRVSMQIECSDCGAGMETSETWIDENSSWNTRAPKSEWISVDDRLPDESHDDCYDEYNVYCKHPFGDKSEDIVTTVDWTEHGWFDCKRMSWNECVTHWMPMPPSPKGK